MEPLDLDQSSMSPALPAPAPALPSPALPSPLAVLATDDVVGSDNGIALTSLTSSPPATPAGQEPLLLPAGAAHMLLAAVTVGVLIRAVTGLTKAPIAGAFWHTIDGRQKIEFLLFLTLLSFFLDVTMFDQHWLLAIGSSVTGLGTAVVSHEWQQLWREAKAESDEVTAAETKAQQQPLPYGITRISPNVINKP